jgi:DNA-binding NtrC family response regulator
LLISALIVDDDEEIRNLLSTILEGEDYSVETAENGKKAIQTCERLSFDVALIDLPDTKETDLLRIMKELQPKMVKINHHWTLFHPKRCKIGQRKSQRYLLKPFEVEELLEMIKKTRNAEDERVFPNVHRGRTSKREQPIFRYQHPDGIPSFITKRRLGPL